MASMANKGVPRHVKPRHAAWRKHGKQISAEICDDRDMQHGKQISAEICDDRDMQHGKHGQEEVGRVGERAEICEGALYTQ